jgi:hypothetical protein
MKNNKFLLLVIALIVPSLIFVFLKFFGTNQFDVPVLFSDRLPQHVQECGLQYPVPYTVADSVLSMEGMTSADSLLVVHFRTAHEGKPLQRVAEKYNAEPVRWKDADLATHAFLMRCIFLMEEPFDVALVDRNGVIRGQYDSSKRDEVDRLITEVAIILKKY